MEVIPLNYLAIVLAAVANMALGFAWYGPVFGKHWQKLMGFTPESMQAMKLSPLQASIGGFVGALLMAYVLAHVIVFGAAFTGTLGLTAGLTAAFWSWLGFVVPVTAGSFLWEGKSAQLWALNAGYYLVALMVMGAILSVWT